MTEFRCPERIFRMFDQEHTKSEGRKAAIEWAETLPLKSGDTVIMPDAETGEPIRMVRGDLLH